MSRYFTKRHASLVPYTPGEQPKIPRLIKLNTNESPYSPTPEVVEAIASAGQTLALYSDPESTDLRKKLSEIYSVDLDEVIVSNGSDEVLNFAIMAFADEEHPLCFPDITYGFYPVWAKLNHIPYEEIPLQADFSVNVSDYLDIHKTIIIANPNAPTGMTLSRSEVETIVKSNPDTVVIIDEAYVDFGGESVVPLIHQYDNLLVTGTFSKSRSMAGGRLGFGFGSSKLIADLKTIQYSTNPYNVNRLTAAAGIATLNQQQLTAERCRTIAETRDNVSAELRHRGFLVLPSKANFIFAKSAVVPGGTLAEALRGEGILVRHFNLPRITDFCRISIGTKEDMQALLQAIDRIEKRYCR